VRHANIEHLLRRVRQSRKHAEQKAAAAAQLEAQAARARKAADQAGRTAATHEERIRQMLHMPPGTDLTDYLREADPR